MKQKCGGANILKRSMISKQLPTLIMSTKLYEKDVIAVVTICDRAPIRCCCDKLYSISIGA